MIGRLVVSGHRGAAAAGCSNRSGASGAESPLPQVISCTNLVNTLARGGAGLEVDADDGWPSPQ
jgi:hypothetical protein